MQEELQSLSKFNSGYLGFTQAEVDEALAGFEEMEKELMEGLLPDEQPEDDLLEAALVCPVCKRGRLQQASEAQVVKSLNFARISACIILIFLLKKKCPYFARTCFQK